MTGDRNMTQDRHLASYRPRSHKGDGDRQRITAWCYRCDDTHTWAQPCPAGDSRDSSIPEPGERR